MSASLTPSGARGNVLSFLASGLQSVGISPAVMRDLTRAILGYVLDHSHGCAPMEQLLGNCAGYEELVSDEFIARIGAMTGSADPVIRRKGLRFLFDLGTRQMANSLGKPGVVGATAAAYWGRWSAAQAEAHAADIVTEAADDSWLRIAALTCGLLSADQALAMPDGLSVLIQDLRGETGELSRASYLVEMGWRILNDRGSADVPDGTVDRRAIEAFAAVGRYVLRHPPPWATVPAVAEHRAYGWALEPAHASFRPDDITYLGIAATVLASSEMGSFDLLVRKGKPAETGPIGLLLPYLHLRGRQRVRDAGLPRLPVPEGSRRLFRDWASGKVSFVQSARHSTLRMVGGKAGSFGIWVGESTGDGGPGKLRPRLDA